MSEALKGYNIPDRLLSELIKYCSTNTNIKKVQLYGSRARGDFRLNSDVDLAFYTSNTTHSEQNLIEYRIQEIPTHLKIDIVFMNRLKKERLIQNIKRDGVILYEQEKALREA